MVEFVNQRMNHGIIKLNDKRINIDSYPQRALFEGIINAVAHRDYYLDGTQIQIDIFKDRLEISSPGGFYRGEKLGKTYDLSGIISKRRNELIAGVLVACNVMEAAGTGFDKIAEEYASVDKKHQPYIYSSSDHFTLVLPDLTYEDGINDNDSAPAVTFMPVKNGTEYDEKILSFCYFKAHRVSEIAEYLGVSDSSYLRKKMLGNLEKNGYLIKDKVSRAIYYKTNQKDEYMVLKKNLNGEEDNFISLTDLHLEKDEKITEIKIYFGNVDVGFKSEKKPHIIMKTNENLENDTKIENSAVLEGYNQDYRVSSKDTAVSTIYNVVQEKKLPRTGF